jgi:hypothetical protein
MITYIGDIVICKRGLGGKCVMYYGKNGGKREQKEERKINNNIYKWANARGEKFILVRDTQSKECLLYNIG